MVGLRGGWMVLGADFVMCPRAEACHPGPQAVQVCPDESRKCHSVRLNVTHTDTHTQTHRVLIIGNRENRQEG